jgi:hypothetical protein
MILQVEFFAAIQRLAAALASGHPPSKPFHERK